MIFKFLVLSWMLEGGFYRCDFDKKPLLRLQIHPSTWEQKDDSNKKTVTKCEKVTPIV